MGVRGRAGEGAGGRWGAQAAGARRRWGAERRADTGGRAGRRANTGARGRRVAGARALAGARTRADAQAGVARGARGLGARAGLGLCTWCTRPVFGPVRLGIFLSQNFWTLFVNPVHEHCSSRNFSKFFFFNLIKNQIKSNKI